MKKFLILLSLFFVTVCYAAPPPGAGAGADLKSVPQYEMATVQDPVDLVVNVPETGIEVQEVAFNYVIYSFVSAGYETTVEPAAETGPAEKPVLLSANKIKESDKPPLKLLFSGAINNHWKFRTNKQHSNYGYPLTANCRDFFHKFGLVRFSNPAPVEERDFL